jgi:hypothetical protein
MRSTYCILVLKDRLEVLNDRVKVVRYYRYEALYVGRKILERSVGEQGNRKCEKTRVKNFDNVIPVMINRGPK